MSLIATIRFWQGRAGSAEEDLDRASEHARRAGDRQQEAEALRWLALVVGQGPMPADEGIRRLESILERARGDRRVELMVARARAVLEAMQGRIESARAVIIRARALARELGDQVAEAAVSRDSGYVELLAGDPGAAEIELRAGYEILDRIGDVGHLASHAPDLGDALAALGRYDEALRVSEFAERITIAGDRDAEVRWRSLRAKSLAGLGRLDEAEAPAAEAVRLAARTDYLDLHADALLIQADVLRLSGRSSDAASAAREALDLYRRKGNVVGERWARALLDVLGA